MRRKTGLVLALAAAATTFVGPAPAGRAPLAAEPVAAQVPRLVDLHVDLPYALHTRKHGIDDAAAPASPERLRRGRVGTLVLPLFVLDAWALGPERARAEYQTSYETLLRALRTPSASRLIGLPGAPESPGRVATVLSFEGADGFADKPDDLTAWVRRGVCFVGLVHTRTNALAGSSTDPDPAQRRVGLTAAGRKVLEVAYRSGAVADGAHASDTAVDEIVALAKLLGAPVVITHTGMRALRATERNADDAHVALVAGTGGVVGIDIHSGHIARRKGATATLDEVVDHIEHAARVGGKDHVAIGSDLDGGIVQPSDADGAASWPLLARKLAARGWSAPEVEALFRGNASRVLGWARARGCGAGLARGASGG